MTASIDSWIPELQTRLRTIVESLRQGTVANRDSLVEENRWLKEQLVVAERDKQEMRDQIVKLEDEKRHLAMAVQTFYGYVGARSQSQDGSSVMSTADYSDYMVRTDNSSDPLLKSQGTDSAVTSSQHEVCCEHETDGPAVMPVAASQMRHSKHGRVVFHDSEQPGTRIDPQRDLEHMRTKPQEQTPLRLRNEFDDRLSFVASSSTGTASRSPVGSQTDVPQSSTHLSRYSSVPVSQSERANAKHHVLLQGTKSKPMQNAPPTQTT